MTTDDLANVVAALLIVVPGAVLLSWVLDWFDRTDEPTAGEEPARSHVTVIPARDWGAEVRAAHRIQQDACLASGDHIAVFDQDAESREVA